MPGHRDSFGVRPWAPFVQTTIPPVSSRASLVSGVSREARRLRSTEENHMEVRNENPQTGQAVARPKTAEGTLLWEPSADRKARARISQYTTWLTERTGRQFPSYDELWRWSVDNVGEFWLSIAEYFRVPLRGDETKPPVSSLEMPGASFFEGRKLNYVSALLASPFGADPKAIAVIAATESGVVEELTFEELVRRARSVQTVLASLGVGRGDRVAAYLPNGVDALASFLAVAGLGAIWSCCSPDFGTRAVVDRFGQIRPKAMLAVTRYSYNGRDFDRRKEVAAIASQLAGLEAVVLFGSSPKPEQRQGGDSPARPTYECADDEAAYDGLPTGQGSPKVIRFEEGRSGETPPELHVEEVPFEHPLWILYSSGTTGLPKPIVHGHGGIVLEHLKALALHMDLGPEDTFFWYTNTGWMMWNFLVSGLLVGAKIVLYDGSPNFPNDYAIWELAERTGITCLGVSGPYVHAQMKRGVAPAARHDLSRITTVGSTGAPLSPDGFSWLYSNVASDLLVASISGGTDVCTAFVGSNPTLPVHAGEIQCRYLGAAVESFDEKGRPLVGEVGELVITKPLPSMPLCFWGDPEMKRYRAAYFDKYPGVWRHGDWIKITERGSCVIYGRSDATLNRAGVRMGTSEFYSVVEALDSVEDSLVVDVPTPDGGSKLFLFVVPSQGCKLDAELESRIRDALKTQLSPRHVPDEIVEVSCVPKTINAKKMEVPVKRLLMGEQPSRAASEGAMANPEALEEYVRLRESLRQRGVLPATTR